MKSAGRQLPRRPPIALSARSVTFIVGEQLAEPDAVVPLQHDRIAVHHQVEQQQPPGCGGPVPQHGAPDEWPDREEAEHVDCFSPPHLLIKLQQSCRDVVLGKPKLFGALDGQYRRSGSTL